MANKLSVAFIGTGIMGAPIAGHILDAGYPVTVTLMVARNFMTKEE